MVEESVDERIREMKKRVKGDYLTQGVAFNKNCDRQMSLLVMALSESKSFSGLVKEMLALRYLGKSSSDKKLEFNESRIELDFDITDWI